MTPNSPDSPRNRWSDLERPPLDAVSLRRALLKRDSLWTSLEVVDRTGSTNSDLAERVRRAAQPGTPGRTREETAEKPPERTAAEPGEGGGEEALDEGAVLIAEEQTAARGRLDRRWSAPPRSGIFMSFLLKPVVPQERWGWLPLLTGVAAATALARTAGVDTALKWPNDLLVDIDGEERKIGGILAERAGEDGVVIGIGLNVSLRAGELPVPTAGSLTLAGAQGTDRDPLLRSVLRSFDDWYGRWTASDGDPGESRLLEAYAAGCSTLGRTVRAELPGGDGLVGEAVAVDGDGRLVLATEQGVQRPVAAGDIVHLRAATEE